MTLDALEPYDRALRDYYFRYEHDATLIVHSDLGEHDEMPVGVFFRGPGDLFPFELVALDHCRGTVLDVGAGTGVDSLLLQARGFSVCAVDIVPSAIEIMRARGVEHVVHGDIRTLEIPPVDTILMVMNGIGFAGTLDGLDRFLAGVSSLLRPEGQILLDSGQAHVRSEPADAPPMQWPARTGDYIGEVWVRLEYDGSEGTPFQELYVDFETLARHARASGWNPQCLFTSEGGGYLAGLTRRKLRSA